MRVMLLGHAGLKIETADATILVDPWLSPEGAYQASWFQYPENQHVINPALFTPTAIVISHEHQDHVDPWLLRQVPPEVPVIIPRYSSPALWKKISSFRPGKIIEVRSWEILKLSEQVSVYFVSEESPMNHDSAVVILGQGHTILNMNDARLSPAQIRRIRNRVGGKIDLLTIQGSGASWYPMCYEYSDEQKMDISRRQRLAKLSYVERAVRASEPDFVMPFAGPPCFLDPELFIHNREMHDGYFPDQHQVEEWLGLQGFKNTVTLFPGDVWDLECQAKEPDRLWEGFSYGDRFDYLNAYANNRRAMIRNVLQRFPHPTVSLWEPFRDYFEKLLQMSPYFNQRIGMRVGFEITGGGGGEWSVDFREGLLGVCQGTNDCVYKYRFESRWLLPILNGTLPWEDFFLSLRFSVWREPDLYNDHLLGLLKFATPEALRAVELFETSLNQEETFTIQTEGRNYEVQRYCPHAGTDLLETAEVLPGRILRCLAHYYEFELESGNCVNGICPRLKTKRR